MKNNLSKLITLILVLILLCLWGSIARSPESKDGVNIYFFDVGQGDAALIQKGHYQILIDGGPDDKILSLLGNVMPIGDREIEEIILSHPHADHLTGINEVIKRYSVDKMYGSGVISGSSIYLEFLTSVRDKKIDFEIPKSGEKESVFDTGSLEFLWPGVKYTGKELDNLNNSSEVLRFCYWQHCALFTGDIENDEQMQMFANVSKFNFKSEILKFPHHGSRNGLSTELLDFTNPTDVIISAGRNNQFGHPHQETLDALNKNKIEILKTMDLGTIKYTISKDLIERGRL